jgi:hypothetical protein
MAANVQHLQAGIRDFAWFLRLGVNLNQATGDLNELKTAGKGVLELITERQM